MQILCNKLDAPQQSVNSLGKYLYNKFPGCFEIKKSSNICELKCLILYREKEPAKDKTTYELNYVINITTYQNKIRLYVQLENGFNVGFKVVNFDKYKTNEELLEDLKKYVVNRLSKLFDEYEFLF